MAKYRILSLDGGGIRGIITAILLERIGLTPGLETWLDKVDLIAGTSTGGILALSLARGLTIQRIRELYEIDGPVIFEDSLWDDIVDLGRLRGADYNLKNLRRILRRELGVNTTLGQLNKHVLITAFDLDDESNNPLQRRWKPKLFHNMPTPNSAVSTKAYKVGVYTSAAPTYFPTEDGYIDGGVYAPNPSMCALAKSQDLRLNSRPPLQDVILLSLGTGQCLERIEGKRLDWGEIQWIKPLVRLMLDGVLGIADFQCHQLLDSRYHRLAPEFPPDVCIPMDAVKKIPYMIQFAQSQNLSNTTQWLQAHWM